MAGGGDDNPLGDAGNRQGNARLRAGRQIDCLRLKAGRGQDRSALARAREFEPSIETGHGGVAGALHPRAANHPSAWVENDTSDFRCLGAENSGAQKQLGKKKERLVHESFPLGTHHEFSQKPVS